MPVEVRPKGNKPARVTKPKPRKPQRHYTDIPIDDSTVFVGRIQAARMLGVNVQTIDALIKAETNALPAYRMGRRVLIKGEDLLRIVEARRV